MKNGIRMMYGVGYPARSKSPPFADRLTDQRSWPRFAGSGGYRITISGEYGYSTSVDRKTHLCGPICFIMKKIMTKWCDVKNLKMTRASLLDHMLCHGKVWLSPSEYRANGKRELIAKVPRNRPRQVGPVSRPRRPKSS